MDGTPILDIKPYLPYTDSHPDAKGGFAEEQNQKTEPLKVEIPSDMEKLFDAEQLKALRGVLAADPRPHYQQDPMRTYGLEFAGCEVKFRIQDGIAYVTEARQLTAATDRP